MAKFCTECGKEIAEGVAFCTECGTKAPVNTQASETVTEEVRTEAPIHTRPVQTYPPQQSYTAPTQTVYAPAAPDPADKVVGTGTYFGLILLFALPVIGLIACLVMAFASKNRNIKHFARAMLIWTIIALVLVGILIAVLTMLANSLMDYINQMTGGELGSLGELFDQLGQLGDLGELGELGELTDIMEQYQNGGLENLPIE